MFRPLLSLLLLLPSTQAVLPTDFWNGKFTTTNWFSDIYVCSSKSTSTGIYYVQGVANKVAYLRGNSTCADSTCTWDGRVYYAGREAVSGSFSFVMSTASGFSGTLSLNGGLAIKNVAITGTKTNNIRPAADLCLESDVDYIESKKPMYSGKHPLPRSSPLSILVFFFLLLLVIPYSPFCLLTTLFFLVSIFPFNSVLSLSLCLPHFRPSFVTFVLLHY